MLCKARHLPCPHYRGRIAGVSKEQRARLKRHVSMSTENVKKKAMERAGQGVRVAQSESGRRPSAVR